MPDWFPDWSGHCAVLLGSGPSAATAGIESARGRVKVIAINESWRLAPWADVLYGCDGNWWKHRRGVPEFKGLKVSQDAAACARYPEIRKVEVKRKVNTILTATPGLIGAGFNGGFQALNLAIQFGARRIVLVGYDMKLTCTVAHWHGEHIGEGLSNPRAETLARWCGIFDGLGPCLERLGAEVINASADSALTLFPKVSLPAALDHWEVSSCAQDALTDS